MRNSMRMLMGMSGLLVLGGCRAATKVTEVPRVDLELTGGNRGYLVGSPPPPAEWKTTRQVVDTTVEVPSFYNPKHETAPVTLGELAPPGGRVPEEEASNAGRYDTYVVQNGESLWSIAAKPEIYGKATMWRRIFDANRELLRKPDRVRPGMTLKIPRGGGGESSATYKK